MYQLDIKIFLYNYTLNLEVLLIKCMPCNVTDLRV